MHRLNRLFTHGLAILVLASCTVAGAARAETDLHAKFDALAVGSFHNKARAIATLAAAGDPRAVRALNAMLAGRLYRRNSDDRAFILVSEDDNSMRLADPLDPKQAVSGKPDDFEKVRINNLVRRAIHGALAGLNLFSADADKRTTAAEAAFQSRSATLLPLLEKALAREKDPAAKAAIERALAATVIEHGENAKRRVAAIQLVAGQRTRAVLALLKPLTVKTGKTYAEKDPQVRKAAIVAVESIENHLALISTLGDVYRGLSLGSVLLLAAIGLAITFGVMGVINMAHGEMVMLGAYTTFVVQEICRTSLPGAFDYSLAVAVPAAFLIAGAVGVAIERGVIRFLYGRPLETLLATWGISLILQQAVRSIFGPTNREVGNPSWMSGSVDIAGLTLTFNRLWIILFSVMVFAALMLLIRKTPLGLRIRAVTQNRRMASAMGIRNGWVDAMTFGLGSGIAGIAGVALSQIDNVSPNLGQGYIIDSFMVVVFGGVGNLWGTLLGAFSIGVINKFLEPYAGAVLGKILVLVVGILFIQRRPQGLFALKGRAAEA